METKTKSETEQTFTRRDVGQAAVGVGLASLLVSSGAMAKNESAAQGKTTTLDGYEGNIAVCTVMIIKEKLESKADDVWDRHKKWLKETHGPWGMVSYTVAKNKEMKDALNPASTETTGRLIYVIHEVYKHSDGLQKHYSESPNGGYVEDFLMLATAEGSSVSVLQGSPVTHSLLPKDCDFPVTISDSEGVEKYFDKDK